MEFKEIEKKWQTYWENNKTFKAGNDTSKEFYYSLCMFPYPSGAGLHVGHPLSYVATDITAKYKKMSGFNVLYPIGWDSFGLPAENYAIKTGVHPKQSTEENIKNFTRQIKSLGLGYDWEREINTSDPNYYKWTQWLFLQLYKNKLAYKKEAPVNWCESCKTVLANEQVIEGRCDRCKNEVVQKKLNQWFFRITDFADELINGLDGLDWPENLKTIQRNWIGRSSGAQVAFNVKDSKEVIEVYTTRPDTLFGATYMVLAPENDILNKLEDKIKNIKEIKEYKIQTQRKTEIERSDLSKTKTGVELVGVKAINPLTNQEIPIFISDYVLTTYGTGAIMAVPAHDQRDYEFAKKFNLPIEKVIDGGDIDKEAWTGDGVLMNSTFLDGMKVEEAKLKMIDYLQENGIGYEKINYKLRDWLISRQRYWGAPIPIILCDECGEVPVPDKDLPVILPEDINFVPTGESPLKLSESFLNVKCPKCNNDAKREVDTMDTFVCSSWYFYRYLDPKNDREFSSKKEMEKWMPVDLYVGGLEHAVLHLLYARFVAKFLHKEGLVLNDEPFYKLRNQGLILGEDGDKMSKSKGNVVNPDEAVQEVGADAFRVYEMFMGPFNDSKPWSTKGLQGARRFLDKVYNNLDKIDSNYLSDSELETVLHQSIKKVSEDIENLRFNTAISQLMILNNLIIEKGVNKEILSIYVQLLSPFAPHIAEEMWSELGNEGSVFESDWPKYNVEKIIESTIEIPVQVNGKIRAKLLVSNDVTKEEVEKLALEEENIKKYIEGKEIKKMIYIEGKILSIMV